MIFNRGPDEYSASRNLVRDWNWEEKNLFPTVAGKVPPFTYCLIYGPDVETNDYRIKIINNET